MSQAKPTIVEATKYAEHFIIYGVMTDAFLKVFPNTKAKPKTVNEKASVFHKKALVQKMIKDLHSKIKKITEVKSLFSIEEAFNELEQARESAFKNNSPEIMIKATEKKCAIVGIVTERSSIETNNTNKSVLNEDDKAELVERMMSVNR